MIALPATNPIAVTDEDIYSGLSLAAPFAGARAAAMGGAGLALVDDPAACRLNPARLTSMSTPAADLDLLQHSIDDSGAHSELIRFNPSVNPFAGTRYSGRSGTDEPLRAGRAAYAHPLPPATPLVVGFSWGRSHDFTTTAHSVTRTTPVEAPVAPSSGDEVLWISRGRLDLTMDRVDLAVGWRPAPGFAVGGALVIGRLDLSAGTTGLLADPLQFTTIGMFDPRFSGSAAVPLVRTTSSGDDTDVAFTFGSWFRPHASLALATTYRRGPRFEIPGVSRDAAAGTAQRFDNIFKVPDAAGVGLAWRPFASHPSAGLQSLTLALDLERVEYGDLLEGMRESENVLTRRSFVKRVSYKVDDATEARLGLEYLRPMLEWTLALRAGVYTQHDPTLKLASLSGDVGALAGQSAALVQGEFYSGQDTEVHTTLGAGARFYNFSVDGALDFSGDSTQAVVSAAWSFR